LTENLSNEKKKSWSKKRKIESKTIDENEYLMQDDSLTIEEDDVDKDPDWKNTPLYNRLQKIQVITRFFIMIVTNMIF